MPKYDRQKCTFPWERCRSTPTSLRTPIWEVHIGVHNTNGCSIGSARRPLCREDRHTDTRTDAPMNSLPTTSAGLMPTEARGNYLPEPPYLRETKDLSQPAIRVDTSCWQLFRPAFNTAHFYFLLQKLCQIT